MYSEYVEKCELEHAGAASEQEYNQYSGSYRRTAADTSIYLDSDYYIDHIECLGHGKVRSIYEKLYRMEEGI